MSDIGVSYTPGYNPTPAPVSISVTASGQELYVTLGNVPTLVVGATPRFSRNVLAGALSVILTPLANSITLSLGLFAGKIMNGQRFSIGKVDPVPFDIQGVRGSLRPDRLSLTARGSELVIRGDFTMT